MTAAFPSVDNRNDLRWLADSLGISATMCVASMATGSVWDEGDAGTELWQIFMSVFQRADRIDVLFFFSFVCSKTTCASLEKCLRILTDPILEPSPREPSEETPHVVSTGCGLAPSQSPRRCPTVKISGAASAERNCRSWQCIDL